MAVKQMLGEGRYISEQGSAYGEMCDSTHLDGVDHFSPHHTGISTFEKVYVVLVLILSTGAFVPSVDAFARNVLPLNGLLWLSLYALLAWGVLRNFRQVSAVANRPRALWALVLFALASVIWLVDGPVTLKESIELFFTTLIGWFVAARWPIQQLLVALRRALSVIALMSLALVVVWPDWGIDGAGNWKGVFGHKNLLGSSMALSTIVWGVHLLHAKDARSRSILAIALSMILIMGSNSQTAVLMAACALVLILISPLLEKIKGGVVGGGLILVALLGIPIATIVDQNLGTITESLGRDVTFSGRTEIWALSWQSIKSELFLGYGFESFWQGLDGPSREIALRMGFVPNNAHNLFLDVGLSLGLFGIVLVVWLWLYALFSAFQLLSRTEGSTFLFVWLSYTLVVNMVGSNLVAARSIWWILFVFALVELSRPHAAGD